MFRQNSTMEEAGSKLKVVERKFDTLVASLSSLNCQPPRHEHD